MYVEFMCLIFNYRTRELIDECNVYHNSVHSQEIYLLNSKAEENFVRYFLYEKLLRIASLEVIF